MHKPALQICAEQLISRVEFEISQNNRYEIYPDMNFISFLNMEKFRKTRPEGNMPFFSFILVNFHIWHHVKATLDLYTK